MRDEATIAREVGTEIANAHSVRRFVRCSTKRYRWAANVARIAMGKKKSWGEKPQDAANDDPLAWWCLTETIAIGGPK